MNLLEADGYSPCYEVDSNYTVLNINLRPSTHFYMMSQNSSTAGDSEVVLFNCFL